MGEFNEHNFAPNEVRMGVDLSKIARAEGVRLQEAEGYFLDEVVEDGFQNQLEYRISPILGTIDSMVVPPVCLEVEAITETAAAAVLGGPDVQNVANPTHANTLAALSQRLGVDLRAAKGGRVTLAKGDTVIVGQVRFPPDVPRETVEYTDDQLVRGIFEFVKVTVS